MSYKTRFKVFFLLLLTVLSNACQEEKSEFKDKVYGRWELTEALRNDRPAASLENIFFEFYEDGKMVTNFNATGDTQTSEYAISGNRIRQKNNDLSPEYIIEEASDTSLMLSTELRNFDFKLLLRKEEAQ